MAEKYGVPIDIDAAVAKRQENYVAILERSDGIAFPGVHALIDAAAADPEWKLAIATSSFLENSRPTLKAARISPDKFDAWITGSDVVKKKPDPEIYLTAAKAIGLDPSVCVVCEDAVQGVAAAKAAGMKCVGVMNSFSREELSEADLVVQSLEEVNLDLLKQLIGR